jgi:hypothetical protein
VKRKGVLGNGRQRERLNVILAPVLTKQKSADLVGHHFAASQTMGMMAQATVEVSHVRLALDRTPVGSALPRARFEGQTSQILLTPL